MREIKFRGLDVMTGKWVYGSLVKISLKGSLAIANLDDQGHLKLYEVDRESVGQYTGLNDDNSKEIYEGDIIYQEFFDDRPIDVGGFTGVVKQYEGTWWIDNAVNHAECLWSELNVNEVLSNIFENPELLEVNDGCTLQCSTITNGNET